MKNIPVSLLPRVGPSDKLYPIIENIRALAEAVETLGGLRPTAAGAQAVTRDELESIGVVAADRSGRIYNPQKINPGLNTGRTLKSTRTGTQVYWEISGSKSATTHVMTGSSLPAGAVIIWAVYRVKAAVTSAESAAVISLGIEGDDPEGLVAPIGISAPSNPWAVGSYSCIPNRRDPSRDTDPATVTGRRAVMTVSGEALTGCDILVAGEYILT